MTANASIVNKLISKLCLSVNKRINETTIHRLNVIKQQLLVLQSTTATVLSISSSSNNNNNNNKQRRGHGMPPTALPSVERYHINHVASETRGLVTLTFDFWTLKLVRVIARGVGNLSTNFDVSETSFSTYGPTTIRRTTLHRYLDL